MPEVGLPFPPHADSGVRTGVDWVATAGAVAGGTGGLPPSAVTGGVGSPSPPSPGSLALSESSRGPLHSYCSCLSGINP